MILIFLLLSVNGAIETIEKKHQIAKIIQVI